MYQGPNAFYTPATEAFYQLTQTSTCISNQMLYLSFMRHYLMLCPKSNPYNIFTLTGYIYQQHKTSPCYQPNIVDTPPDSFNKATPESYFVV